MSQKKQKLTYRSAGVDVAAGNRFVGAIGPWVKWTQNKRVKKVQGGYASVYDLGGGRFLAASTDGVGTKLKLAFDLNRHGTVGIDLVAMSVNDLLCVGAKPLFFLDYFATGKLKSKTAVQVVSGIAKGCKQAHCALVGGETAEMPGFYQSGEYDLAGFAVGEMKASALLPKALKKGDVLLGLSSSGFHSNGYSLLRKLLPPGAAGKKVARQLLEPTRLYVKSFSPLLGKGVLKGLCHVTGGGFQNVTRLSSSVSFQVELPPLGERPKVFQWLQKAAQLPLKETARTFNCGVGMVVVVDPKNVKSVMKSLKQSGEKVWVLGEAISKRKGKKTEICVREGDAITWISAH